jgi:hypothetical protein
MSRHSAITLSNVIAFPTIAGVEVTTDSEGRFNLNAIHRAYEAHTSTKQPSKAPAQWQRTKQAQEFVYEVERQTMQICIVSTTGRDGGTFAHELAAVEYAGWMSPAFRIKVNQTFIDYRTGKANTPLSPAELIIAQGQALLAVEQQQARQAQQIAALEHRVDLMDGDTGYQTVTAYIRKHGWKLPLSQAKAIGQRAAKLAKELGVQIGTVPDERWGTVNSYPVALLAEVVAEFFRKENAA